MALDHVDIDRLINWEQFYGQYLTNQKPCGDHKQHACCPFHSEREPSFWYNTKNGMWKCEAGCGSGNATTFLARIEGIGTAEAYKKLLKIAGADSETAARREDPLYSMKQYAMEKRFPEEFLTGLGVKNATKYSVAIPYKDEAGSICCTRYRFAKGARKRFSWARGSHTCLYGLWRLCEAAEMGYIVIVEGESDAQTLWLHGIPAVGIPGASTFKDADARKLERIPKIYLHQEPDRGGETARRGVATALANIEYSGQLYVWGCSEKGAKDPSDLYAALGDAFHGAIMELLKGAEAVNPQVIATSAPTGLEDAPLAFRVPAGYLVDSDGITAPRDAGGMLEAEPFTWTPIIISRILPAAFGDVKVDLAIRINGVWRNTVVKRGIIATSRTVTLLADMGADVTSENAAKVVRWLSAYEKANQEIIPKVARVTHYGWVDEEHFLPGALEDYYFDSSEGSAGRGEIGQEKGSTKTWVAAMQPHREKNMIFRFLLASAFAAPLLKVLGQRIFMVYNWGGSKGGKSAALNAALSAWGNPVQLLTSFDATKVGLENTAAFFCDLPLGINERQLAGDKQGFLETLVYMLSEGKGRIRGTKDGGLREQKTWRTIVIANGEESLTSATSQTGISTRVLEIYGVPFLVEDEASAMYDIVANNYGKAGPRFIKWLIDYMKTNPGMAQSLYENLRSYALQSDGISRSHASSLAVVGLADFMYSWAFARIDPKIALETAKLMISEIMTRMETVGESDVNVKAYQFIVDWILANRTEFTDSFRRERFGMFDMADTDNVDMTHVWVLPTVLEAAVTRRGYNFQKTIRWMMEQGKVRIRMVGEKMQYTIVKKFMRINTRMICVNLPETEGAPAQGAIEVSMDANNPFYGVEEERTE